jgi:uncharacterized membrane protein
LEEEKKRRQLLASCGAIDHSWKAFCLCADTSVISFIPLVIICCSVGLVVLCVGVSIPLFVRVWIIECVVRKLQKKKKTENGKCERKETYCGKLQGRNR